MIKNIIVLLLISAGVYAQRDTLNVLSVGDKAPAFDIVDHSGVRIQLEKLLEKGKVIIVFYRGAWCPYCNRHMSNLQDSASQIFSKGATLVAITPEIDASIEKTISKTKVSFPIIHDSTYVIMKRYGVAFKVSEFTVKKYKIVGIDLEESNGNKDNVLPVPATFIIAQDGTITYLHFDENYKKRLSIKEILNQL